MAGELCEGGEKSNEMVVGGGFFYNSNSNSNNIPNQFTNQIQTGFGSTTEHATEMFNESSGGGGGDDDESFHQNMMVVGPWGTTTTTMATTDSSLRCVFPCEPNERPSQGLSLSLSSSNPSSIGLQSFELRQQHQSSFPIFHLRNSRFLIPTQELLYEFCSLGITNNINHSSSSPKQKHGSSSTTFSLQSLDFMDLQKRKTKLFSMLEEVNLIYFSLVNFTYSSRTRVKTKSSLLYFKWVGVKIQTLTRNSCKVPNFKFPLLWDSGFFFFFTFIKCSCPQP